MMGDSTTLVQAWTYEDLKLELEGADPKARVRQRIETFARTRGIGLYEYHDLGTCFMAYFTNPIGQPDRVRDKSGRWLRR